MQVRSDVGPLGRPHPLGLLALQPAIEPQRERCRDDDRPREHGGTGERAVDNPTRALPLRDDDDDADHRQRDADDDLHDADPTGSGPAAATPGAARAGSRTQGGIAGQGDATDNLRANRRAARAAEARSGAQGDQAQQNRQPAQQRRQR